MLYSWENRKELRIGRGARESDAIKGETVSIYEFVMCDGSPTIEIVELHFRSVSCTGR